VSTNENEHLAGEIESPATGDTNSPEESLDGDVVVAEALVEAAPQGDSLAPVKAIVEAAIYITDQPLTAEQIAAAIEQPIASIKAILAELVAEYSAPDRGLSIRELAGGYKMSTKPEHHDAVRRFVRNLQPALKLSLAALETLAVIAYKQPITSPEVMEIRGVQGTGVLKTLLDRKLIATAGRKNVIGKPMMYKTTREFLVQFGLNSLAELPTLKEFEELGRLSLAESPTETPTEPPEQSQMAPEAAAEEEARIEDETAAWHGGENA
jgi:segregation and condensation protein B